MFPPQFNTSWHTFVSQSRIVLEKDRFGSHLFDIVAIVEASGTLGMSILYQAQITLLSLLVAIILIGLGVAHRLTTALWWGIGVLFLAFGTTLWGISIHQEVGAVWLWAGYIVCVAAFALCLWAGRKSTEVEQSTEGEIRWFPSWSSLAIAVPILVGTIGFSIWAGMQKPHRDDHLLIVRFGIVAGIFLAMGIVLFSRPNPVRRVFTASMMRYALSGVISFEIMVLLLLGLYVVANFETNRILREIPLLEVIAIAFLLMALIVQSYEQVGLRYQKSFNQLSKSYKKYKEMAHRDPLTAVLNRHALYLLFDNKRKQTNEEKSGSVAVIDIDNLKPINDKHGHTAGDAAIRVVAKTIRSIIRAEDLLFRWGGDEFLVILPHMQPQDVRTRFDKLNPQLKQTSLIDIPHPIELSTSVGISGFQTFDELERAIQEADERMYSRKVESKTIKQLKRDVNDG